MNLQSLLPHLLPRAIAWAESVAHQAALQGIALTATQLDVARRVGVQYPEKIRIMQVDRLPFPEEPTLREAAIEAGMLGPEMVGLTLGYSIFVVHGHDDTRLVSHECRHVHQYETLGSIDLFLPVYLQQILDHGYHDAPLEVDARAHEINT